MTKTKYRATNRNDGNSLFSSTSLWEVLRFVAYYFRQDGQSITIYKE